MVADGPRRAGAAVTMPVRPASLPVMFALALLLGTVEPVVSQTRIGRARSLQGRVIDAVLGTPVMAAKIVMTPATALESRRQGDEGAPWRVETDSTGWYLLRDVPPGLYRMRVSRIGYEAANLEVRVGSLVATKVSVALRIEAIQLEPIEVTARGATELRDGVGRRVPTGRSSSARLRQARFLTSDTRLVTPQDLAESVTLGEIDVFRALQRLPGVSARDDFSAELWVRGAAWGETRVYLDGLPLFNPLHGFGLLSGLTSRGVGSVVLHPGVHPVALPEGGSAVVDLTTRSGTGTHGIEGGLDLSLASAQAWGAGSIGEEESGWFVAARRSYADFLVPRLGGGDTAFPFAFADVQGRLDLDLGSGATLDATALWENDDLRGEIPDVLQRTAAGWGNVLAAVGLSLPAGSYLVHGSVGATRYHARVRAIPGAYEGRFNAPSADPADHGMAYQTAGVAISPGAEGGDTLWSAGLDLAHQGSRYAGPEPWPYSIRPPDLAAARWDLGLTRVGVWGHRRWSLGPLSVDAGLRVNGGQRTRGGIVELLPALSTRWVVGERVTLFAAIGRSVQYAQSPAEVGPRVQRGLASGRLWILAGPATAPLTVRTGTVGGEAWLGSGWLASATAYLRRSDGLLLPDPTPGPLIQRPPLVEGWAGARGMELSLRRLGGRVTGWASYSLGRARAHALGRTFPAPTDRARVFDATTRVHLGSAWGVGLAYVHASGAPFARAADPCDFGHCAPGVVLDAPFLRRSPPYASLDLQATWDHRFDGWSLGVFLQGRNLLDHDNAVTYERSDLACGGGLYVSGGLCPDGRAPHWEDRFQAGIPTLPLLGLRVRF